LYNKKLLVYRLEILFVAFLIIGYASYIILDLVKEKENLIASSQYEIKGVQTLPYIKELFIQTQKLRGIEASYKAGDASLHSLLQQQILIVQNSLQTTKTILQKTDFQGTFPLFLAIEKELQKNMQHAFVKQEKSFQKYSDIVSDEISLIVKIGDMSKLILDPDLDIYYLVDLMLHKLPLVVEAVGQIRGFGSMILTQKKESTQEQIHLAILLGRIKDNTLLIQNGLSSAYTFNKNLEVSIKPIFQQYLEVVDTFDAEVMDLFQNYYNKSPKSFFHDGTEVINKAILLYNKSDEYLIKLLQLRIDEMISQRNRVIGKGIVFLAILLFLFYMAYGYLYKNFLILEAEKKRQRILDELEKTNDSLIHALTYDQLTNIYNRSFLIEMLRESDKDTVLMLINIKAFKEINDIYGNEFGDKVLIAFTNYLKQFFEHIPHTTLFRVGGDEFAVLIQNISSFQVMLIGSSLEGSIREKNFIINDIRFNFSILVAVSAIAPLLENADLALKMAKKDPHKKVVEYKEELSIKKEWQKNIEVINIVKLALQEDRIVPYFQGIVNLQTMKIEKYEVLARLILPSGEVLSPYVFLERVSKTDYYYDITEVMLQKTFQMAKEYKDINFSLNFSMKDITNKYVLSTLFSLFEANKEIAKRIDIELLETEFIDINNNDEISHFIQKVHSYGSKVLIDDFGTGYSNFSYLSDLDIDIIKIDASIIKEIVSNQRKLHILQTIYEFSQGLGILNVAEYVETKEIALLLKEIGIRYAQGYFFSKPLPKPLSYTDVTL